MMNTLKRWFNRQSLAYKLSISILICVFVVFTALVLFLSEKAERIVEEKSEEIGAKAVQSYVSDITHLALDTEQLVLNTKNLLNQLKDNNVETVELVLNSAIKTIYRSPLTFTEAWVYVFPPEDVSYGTLYRSTDLKGDVSFKAQNVQNFYEIFPWFKEVPKVEEIYWSEPYIDKDTKKAVVTCLVPFMFQNSTDFDGLVALTVDLSKMKESIESFSSTETGKLLLVSKNGLYITHPRPEVALKMTIFDLAKKNKVPELAKSGEEVLRGQSGMVKLSYSSIFEGPAIVFYAPIKRLQWGLRLVYSENEIFKPIRKVKYVMMLPLVAGMLILFLIVYQICHKSTKQLLSLSKIAVQYGMGNFEKSFEGTASAREIGMLSKAMNDMRKNLLNYIEKEKEEVIEKQKSESELNIAQNIQNAALSTDYPRHRAFDLATKMVPARQVGGDFYDFFFIDKNHFAILVADVSGKGIPAALYMMKAQALIKNTAKSKKPLAEVFYEVNNELYEGNESCMFVSAFMAVINISNGMTEYVNAGHTHPLLDNGNGYEFIRPEKNVVLGVRKNMRFVTQKLKMKTNSRIFLYTDGVTEAESQKLSFYGEERLKKILAKKYDSPSSTMDNVLKNIQKFAGNMPQSDDITMLEFWYLGLNGDQITLAAKMENLVKALEFLKKDMEKRKILQSVQFRLISAAEEVFVNVVSYAYPNFDDGIIDIVTDYRDNVYMASFVDSGRKYDPLAIKEPKVDEKLETRKIGGLGIFLVKKLADNVEYEYNNNHNVLRIEMENKEK